MTRFFALVLLLLAPSIRAADSPLATGEFLWNSTQPVVSPAQRGDHCYSVKDPSIVRYNGRWHLFCTIRSEKRSHQIEYLSFDDWPNAI